MNINLTRRVNLLLFSSLFIALSLSILVIAAHVITPTSQNVVEDRSTLYNVTINNSDTTETANITQVNITFTSNFTFTAGTNGTDAGTHTFTNTSTVLSWTNAAGLVMNLTLNRFWFNLTGSTLGNHNLTIITVNATGAYYNNITVNVNDSTSPSSITYDSPSYANGANVSRTFIIVNTTVTDNGIVQYVNITLYNSTHFPINSSVNTTNTASPKSFYANFSGLATDGIYYYNVTRANDTYGNANTTASTYTVRVDTIAPATIYLIDPLNDSSLTSAHNFTFNVTDSGSGVQNCSLVLDGAVVSTLGTINNSRYTNGIYWSSMSEGYHLWMITCTDYASNTNSSETRRFYIPYTENTTGSGSSGGGSSGGSSVYNPSAQSLVNGYTVTMPQGARVNFDVGSAEHTLTMGSVTSTSATFTIASTPQTATLSVGQTGKYDVDGDGIDYDVKVYLSQIIPSSATRAKVIITSINEQMPSSEYENEEPQNSPEQPEVVEDVVPTIPQDEPSNSSLTKMIIAIVLLVAVGVFIAIKLHKKGRHSSR